MKKSAKRKKNGNVNGSAKQNEGKAKLATRALCLLMALLMLGSLTTMLFEALITPETQMLVDDTPTESGTIVTSLAGATDADLKEYGAQAYAAEATGFDPYALIKNR